MKASHARAYADQRPDMTSMLDVVFIMLIFFVVTASFVHPTGITPNLDRPEGGPVSPLTPIGFRIDATDRIFHDGRLIDPWSVAAIVKTESTSRPKAPVMIATDRAAHTKTMVRVFDAARQAGMPVGKIGVQVD